MTDYLQFALVTFTSLLFIVDTVAVIPTYLVITQGQSVERRRRTALRASIAAGVLMTVFGIAGTGIFKIFGITLPAFRIAFAPVTNAEYRCFVDAGDRKSVV